MDLSTPAPIMRPTIPGSRGARAPPRLGLAIPPSPSARAVDATTLHTDDQALKRPAPPRLTLATPMGSDVTPLSGNRAEKRGRLPPLQVPKLSTTGSSDTSAVSKSESSEEIAGSHFTPLIPRQPGSSEHLSAISATHSVGGTDNLDSLLPDLAALSLEKGRPLDVEDLDEGGWRAASKNGQIIELGSLGEGAGGAVNKCILKDAKTVFALKVISFELPIIQRS